MTRFLPLSLWSLMPFALGALATLIKNGQGFIGFMLELITLLTFIFYGYYTKYFSREGAPFFKSILCIHGFGLFLLMGSALFTFLLPGGSLPALWEKVTNLYSMSTYQFSFHFVWLRGIMRSTGFFARFPGFASILMHVGVTLIISIFVFVMDRRGKIKDVPTRWDLQ